MNFFNTTDFLRLDKGSSVPEESHVYTYIVWIRGNHSEIFGFTVHEYGDATHDEKRLLARERVRQINEQVSSMVYTGFDRCTNHLVLVCFDVDRKRSKG